MGVPKNGRKIKDLQYFPRFYLEAARQDLKHGIPAPAVTWSARMSAYRRAYSAISTFRTQGDPDRGDFASPTHASDPTSGSVQVVPVGRGERPPATDTLPATVRDAHTGSRSTARRTPGADTALRHLQAPRLEVGTVTRTHPEPPPTYRINPDHAVAVPRPCRPPV